MNLQEATEFISFANTNSLPQLWLDLGCGSGLFTEALAHYLPAESKIIAVDKNEKALKEIPDRVQSVIIETRIADFIHDPLNVKEVYGILMANSLHYVEDKESFLEKLSTLVQNNSVFLLVEYDRSTANPWVPYPVTINTAKDIFLKSGYSQFGLLKKKRSLYGNLSMYVALIK